MPNFRPTSTGFQTKGRLNRFFEPQTVSLVMGVFVFSIMFSFVSMFILGIGMLFTLVAVLIVPNGISLYIAFFLIQGKPKGYLSDWFRSNVLGHTSAHAWEDKTPPIEEI